MTNEAMLKVIYDVMDNGVDLPKLQDVVDKLKDDIALEKCSSVTEKNMLTACRKILKKRIRFQTCFKEDRRARNQWCYVSSHDRLVPCCVVEETT